MGIAAKSERRLVKSTVAVVAVVAATVLFAVPSRAIIGGEVDGTRHPYVGAIDARLIGGHVTPSGVLISPTVFLTAGHATRRWDNAGVSRARVTFDPVVTATSTWYWGTVHTDPAYDPDSASDPNDLGVIVFDSPIPGITPASLPTQGLLDQLGPQGLSSQTFTVVGYGVTRFVAGSNGAGDPEPDLTSGGTRKLAHQSFDSLTPAWLRVGEHLDGQICSGDSGSPGLLGGSNVIAGITAVDFPGCDNAAWDMRLDTAPHRAFLAQYVTLP